MKELPPQRWSPHSVGGRKYGWCCASGRAYLQKHKINKLNSVTSSQYIARVTAIMLDEKNETTKKSYGDVEEPDGDKREGWYGVCNSWSHTRRMESNTGPKACKADTHTCTWGAEVGRYYLYLYRTFIVRSLRNKIERKCIPNTTYGSFRDYVKSGKWSVSHAHLNRSNMVPIDFSIENFEFCECLRMMINVDMRSWW